MRSASHRRTCHFPESGTKAPMGSRSSRTASCAFSVVPAGLASGRRSSSQDCVLGYFLSSLRDCLSCSDRVPSNLSTGSRGQFQYRR